MKYTDFKVCITDFKVNTPKMEARIAQLEAKVATQERQIAELVRLLKVQTAAEKSRYNFADDEPTLYRWTGK
jgi:hypothetical protein